MTDTPIGREILSDEQASANYRLRHVRTRSTGIESWEVVDTASAATVATGLSTRDEAIRVVRAWEQLNQRLEGGLPGHVLPH